MIMKQPAAKRFKQSKLVVCYNVFQESCEWRWRLCHTITPYPQTAAHPQATPALPAPPEHHSAVTPPSTGAETFTGVIFLTGLLNYYVIMSDKLDKSKEGR